MVSPKDLWLAHYWAEATDLRLDSLKGGEKADSMVTLSAVLWDLLKVSIKVDLVADLTVPK